MSYLMMRVVESKSPYAMPALSIQQASFPHHELMTDRFWQNMLEVIATKPDYHWYAILDDSNERQVVGMIFFEIVRPNENSIPGASLWYVSIDYKHRGRGAGTVAYKTIVSLVKSLGCNELLFEVEIPEHYEVGSDEFCFAQKRIEWYRRNGAKLLSGIKWWQEVDSGSPPTEMSLMVDTLGKSPTVNDVYDRACLVLGKDIEQTGLLILE